MLDHLPQVHYHCSSCHNVTGAPFGQEVTICSLCGRPVDETPLVLELLGLAVLAEQDEQRRREYARADAEVTFLLTTPPLELAALRRAVRPS